MNAEKILTLLLRLNASLLLLALPTALLPNSWMADIHQNWLNMGSFPDQPITEYLARSCSLLYALHGAVLMMVAIKPRRHWSLIGPIAILHLLLGLAMFATDLKAGMPWFWTAGEGIPIFIYGLLLFWLWKKAGAQAEG